MLHYSYRRYSEKRAKKWKKINACWNNKLKSIRAKQSAKIPRGNTQWWNITNSHPRIVWGENLKHAKDDQETEKRRKKEKSWTYKNEHQQQMAPIDHQQTPWKRTMRPVLTELQEVSERPRKHDSRVVKLTTEAHSENNTWKRTSRPIQTELQVLERPRKHDIRVVKMTTEARSENSKKGRTVVVSEGTPTTHRQCSDDIRNDVRRTEGP